MSIARIPEQLKGARFEPWLHSYLRGMQRNMPMCYQVEDAVHMAGCTGEDVDVLFFTECKVSRAPMGDVVIVWKHMDSWRTFENFFSKGGVRMSFRGHPKMSRDYVDRMLYVNPCKMLYRLTKEVREYCIDATMLCDTGCTWERCSRTV